MDGEGTRKIVFTGKQANDAFRPKAKRIRSKAVDTEPDHNGQLSLLQECGSRVCSAIDSKVNGYKQQDIKRSLLNVETLITRDQAVEKLKLIGLVCHYCKCQVKILYRTVRDPKQWTLDRIDNDMGHSSENTVISCLSCNLKRRRLDKEVFETTRNIVVVKGIREDNIDNVQDEISGNS